MIRQTPTGNDYAFLLQIVTRREPSLPNCWEQWLTHPARLLDDRGACRSSHDLWLRSRIAGDHAGSFCAISRRLTIMSAHQGSCGL